MALKLIKEKLVGKYDGLAPANLLPEGSVSGGLNMRKVSALGGWKARKGCTIHNTTAIAAKSVLSLHQYTHPRNADYHFLAQCNSKLYDATNDPPASGAAFGTDITNSQTIDSSSPGFSDIIGEKWIYADGNSVLSWGGTSPFCEGFLSYDYSEDTYNDFTRDVTDNQSTTKGLILGAVDDSLYICSPEIANTISLTLGTGINTSEAVSTVSSWQSGAWTNRSATDNTADSGKTLAKSGTFTWTPSSSDTMRILGGIMGYWYKISFSANLSNSVEVIHCKVNYNLTALTNKWSGIYQTPLTVIFYDDSEGESVDYTVKLTSESFGTYMEMAGATESDYIYVKSAIPLTGFGLGVADEYENTEASVFDQIDDWDGDSWNAITTGIIDTTLNVTATASLAQTGTILWNAAGRTVKKRTMSFDSLPGYWYRLSWTAPMDGINESVRLFYLATVTFPEALFSYDGVVEFKGRAMYWGDPKYPNRLRFSVVSRPDAVEEEGKSYTAEFGRMTKINRAIRFYNELLVFKEDSIWLLEGYAPENFGILRLTDTVGCCAPKTVASIEVGFAGMHADEPLTIAIWVDTDGVYILDGRKPRKISEPIRQYFDTEYSTAIAAANLAKLQAFVDPLKNEYHLLLPNGTELVYNYVYEEWYPPWERTVGASTSYVTCGLNFRGTDNRYYVYAGNSAGMVFKLEADTSDKNEANADVAIHQKLKSRAISYEQADTYSVDFLFRGVTLEAKARTSGSVITTFYKDLQTSGTALAVPANISLVNTGYGLAIDRVDTSQQNCMCFQLEFEANTIDLELEFYSFLYQIDVEGIKEA